MLSSRLGGEYPLQLSLCGSGVGLSFMGCWRPRESRSGTQVSCKQFIARSFPPTLLAARKSSRKIFPWELFLFLPLCLYA